MYAERPTCWGTQESGTQHALDISMQARLQSMQVALMCQQSHVPIVVPIDASPFFPFSVGESWAPSPPLLGGLSSGQPIAARARPWLRARVSGPGVALNINTDSLPKCIAVLVKTRGYFYSE
jgi:hypothetical protein